MKEHDAVSHYFPPQDYIEEQQPTFIEAIKNIFKPKPIIKHVHLSNIDYKPAYEEESKLRKEAQAESRDLREELRTIRTKHMKEKDELNERIYTLEDENNRLRELAELNVKMLL